MDFARKQLEKYGWTDGKGLGKNETGISKAIRPKLKFDTAGIGHDRAEQFTYHWWENVYNEAASNINVKKVDDSVTVQLNNEESVNITTNKYGKFKKSKTKDDNSNKMEYGVFLKKSTLTQSGVIENNDMSIEVPAEEPKKKSKCNSGISSLTDEEIFAACGGRTAHKGARHGLQLKGKLARIEEQERQLLAKMQNPQSICSKKGLSPLLRTESKDGSEEMNDDKLSEQSSVSNHCPEMLNTKLAVPKVKRKRCDICNHKRCRCDVFEVKVIEANTLGSGLGKRKLFNLPDTLPDHIGIGSKYERVRNPNDTTHIHQSPYSENAQNKRRKLGVSSILQEQKCEKVRKRKMKNKSKKLKKQVSKITNSLDDLIL